MDTTSAKDTVAAGMLRLAQQRLVGEYPFHARLVAGWEAEACWSLRTMGVTVRSLNVALLFSPEFVVGCSLPELVGVLHHEVNHVLFGHLWADPRAYPDAEARLIAEEVTVNEWVPEPLPGQPITLVQFPGLPPDEDTDTRYRRLEQKGARPELKSAQQEPKSGGTEPKIGSAVQPLDDHGLWAEARTSGTLGRWAVEAAVRQAWEGLDQAQRQRIPWSLRQHVEAIGRGDAPGACIEALSECEGQSAQVDWRRALRCYVRQMGLPQPCFLRPPRRLPHLVGLVPGHVYRPQKANVMAVVDTSGSIDTAALQAIAAELDLLGRTHEVTVVECDATVQAVYRFSEHFRMARGRGGTDLRPPFERDLLRQVRPDVIVYFTDGQGPAPARAPAVGVLWCLTPSGRRPAAWGRALHIIDKSEKRSGNLEKRKPGFRRTRGRVRGGSSG